MRPAQLTRLVVDRFQHALTPNRVIRAGPSERSILRLGEIDSVGRMRIHDEQPGLRIETRRAVIRQASFVRRDQPSVTSRLLLWIRNWPPLLIDTERPIHRSIRRGEE